MIPPSLHTNCPAYTVCSLPAVRATRMMKALSSHVLIGRNHMASLYCFSFNRGNQSHPLCVMCAEQVQAVFVSIDYLSFPRAMIGGRARVQLILFSSFYFHCLSYSCSLFLSTSASAIAPISAPLSRSSIRRLCTLSLCTRTSLISRVS